MHRFYLPPERCQGATLLLDGREAHHAFRVLRLRWGDAVTVLDGAGGEFTCEVHEASRDAVALQVLASRRHDRPPVELTLMQALPKGRLIEFIIQKATELGAARIVPMITERVVSHLDNESAVARAERWQLPAVEAVKQCGCPWLPVIEVPQSLDAVLTQPRREELAMLASLQPDVRHPREMVSAFVAEQGRKPRSASLWIGPEGDFSPAEIEAIHHAGARPVTLGRNVLRVDTAALAGLAILQSELA